MYIYKAAVIGAGAMGAEIAQVITYAGIPVILKDINQEFVDKGLVKIRSIYEGRVKKGKMTAEQLESKLALVTGATTYDDFKDVDLVIEAVSEKMEIKKKVFEELDQALPTSAILSSNTSSLSISALGSATKRPDKVVGLHFFTSSCDEIGGSYPGTSNQSAHSSGHDRICRKTPEDSDSGK